MTQQSWLSFCFHYNTGNPGFGRDANVVYYVSFAPAVVQNGYLNAFKVSSYSSNLSSSAGMVGKFNYFASSAESVGEFRFG